MAFNLGEPPDERLFKASLGFAAEEREAFIRSSAGEDSALFEGAMELLAGYNEHGGDGADATLADESGTARKLWATSTEEGGTVIGKFKLVRMAGKGGMGTVWEAEQVEPIVRRVALKVIKLGMDTEEVVKRFERERQMLSVMENANIAVVYEVGATELGRPYFAMEFVDGESITAYAAKHELSVEERLRLMLAVCSGIEHAHHKGVIHRDLKPSNILVTDAGVPKIIDFGIAKAAADDGGTLFTRDSQMLGTPAYMSPEQATGLVSAIDTRSDVYSLGVVLYELLAGDPPFDSQRLESEGLAEMQKILAEEEPPRPSVRNSSISTKSGKFAQEFPLLKFEKGLDWIVMKALSKEPERRYQNVSGLREDIQRYLDGATVRAVPPSFTYWLSNFSRRHRTAVFLLASVFIAAIAGLFWKLQTKRESLSASRLIAEEHAARAAVLAGDGKPLLAALWHSIAAEAVSDDSDLQHEYFELAARATSLSAVPVLALRLDRVDVCRLTYDQSGRYVIIKARGGEEWLFDLAKRKKVSFAGFSDFDALAFSPDGKRIATVRTGEGMVNLWSLPLGEERFGTQIISERKNPRIGCLAFDASGTRLVVAVRKNVKVLLIDNDGSIRDSGLFVEHISNVSQIGFSPTSVDALAIIGENRELSLVNLDLEAGIVTELLAPTHRWATGLQTDVITPPIFSDDGRLFVPRAKGGWSIFEVNPFELLGSKTRAEMNFFDMTPDGALGLVRTEARGQRLYVDQMNVEETLFGEADFPGVVTCAMFSRDSKHAVGGDSVGSIQVLSAAAEGWKMTSSLPSALADKSGAVTAIAFSPDGRFVLSSQYQGGDQNWSLIRLWRLPSTGGTPLIATDMSLDLAMVNAATTLTSQGSAVPIPAEEWWARWEDFRREYPEFPGHDSGH